MKRIIFYIGIATIFVTEGCQHSKPSGAVKEKYTLKVFEVTSGGFGYDIFKGNLIMIHQPNIPTISGNSAFKTKIDAENVAKLMVYKLDHGIMPPSISENELDSLNVKRK